MDEGGGSGREGGRPRPAARGDGGDSGAEPVPARAPPSAAPPAAPLPPYLRADGHLRVRVALAVRLCAPVVRQLKHGGALLGAVACGGGGATSMAAQVRRRRAGVRQEGVLQGRPVLPVDARHRPSSASKEGMHPRTPAPPTHPGRPACTCTRGCHASAAAACPAPLRGHGRRRRRRACQRRSPARRRCRPALLLSCPRMGLRPRMAPRMRLPLPAPTCIELDALVQVAHPQHDLYRWRRQESNRHERRGTGQRRPGRTSLQHHSGQQGSATSAPGPAAPGSPPPAESARTCSRWLRPTGRVGRH